MRIVLLSLLALAGLAACAAYQPLAPGPVPPLPSRAGDVRVDAAALAFPHLAGYRFDPSDGLDETETAMLAVANNPDLRLARDDAAIAHAQAFAAGLLPDPQLALSRDLSNNSTGPDASRAFGVGLSYDVNPLIQRVSGVRAARAEERKTSLVLLWQEWQVVSQARLLYTRLLHGRRLLALLEDGQRLARDQARRLAQARERGLVASDAVLPALASLQDLDRQVYDARRQAQQHARDLNALLGLDADAGVPLQSGGAFPPAPAPDAVLADLRARRPDLLALEAGYAAQDQRYRGAVLAQFPALNVGLTRARDSGSIDSTALGITLSLPFLNGNRGNIAIERATRRKVYDEYRQRIQASRGEIAALLRQRTLDGEQLARTRAAVAQLAAAFARTDAALRAGTADVLAYAGARSALMARQVEQINLEQQVAEQGIALQTLLGVDPSAPSDPHPSAMQSPR